MLKDIIHTVGSRYIVAFLNLALIFINVKVLSIKEVGTIGLIWASVYIIIMINSVLSGSTLVYFVNKYPIRLIYPIAFLWIFLGSAIGYFAMELLGMLPEGYALDIYLIAVLYSIVVAHSRFLLAKDHIRGFNLVNILQGGILFFALVSLYFIAGRQEVSSYVWGLYITNGIALIVSIFILAGVLRKDKTEKEKETGKSPFLVLREMFAYGLWGSADNLAEACTARLNYFFVERFLGLGSVGLLDVGTKVSESVWNISRSVAYIEYNRVAKESESEIQKRITLRLLKLTFLVMVFIMGCILLIPEWVYTDILFSSDFAGVRNVIIALSAGIITLGCNTILSHYYIGSGKIRYSTFSSCVGIVTLLIFGPILIPIYGVIGSAISTSIAFTAMLIFSLIVFSLQTRTTFKEFLPNKEDIIYIKELIKRKKTPTLPN